MKLIIEIDCDNSAFGEGCADLAQELASIAADLHRRIAGHHPELQPDNLPGSSYPLRDTNGNRVGWAKFTRGDL